MEDLFRRKAEPGHQWTFVDFSDGTASLAREVFLASGGFDLDLKRRQDWELGLRLLERGVSFAFYPAARAWHHADVSLDAAMRNIRQEARGDVLFARKHPHVKGRLPLARFTGGDGGLSGLRAAAFRRPGAIAAAAARGLALAPALDALALRGVWTRLVGMLRTNAYLLGVRDVLPSAEEFREFMDLGEPAERVPVSLEGDGDVRVPSAAGAVELSLSCGGAELARIDAIELGESWDWAVARERVLDEALAPLVAGCPRRAPTGMRWTATPERCDNGRRALLTPMLAYLLLAYKNLDQLVRLVTTLDTGRSVFFVHVDKSTDRSAWARELAALEERPSVRFVKPHRCGWGGFGLVTAILWGIGTALDSDIGWEHLVLLSGQDYPIKPVARIQAFFEDHRDESFVEYFLLPRADWPGRGGMERIEDWHRHVGKRLVHVHAARYRLRRSVPGGLRPYQGGSNFALSTECARYVRDFAAENPRFSRFFRHTSNPDESFFQTILLNSPLAAKVVNDDLRYEEWTAGEAHPAILRAGDLPKLRRAEGLTARKFDTTVDAEILDLIDREILGLAQA